MGFGECPVVNAPVDLLPGYATQPGSKLDGDERVTLDHERCGDLRFKIRLDAFGEIRHGFLIKRSSMFDLLSPVRRRSEPRQPCVPLVVLRFSGPYPSIQPMIA